MALRFDWVFEGFIGAAAAALQVGHGVFQFYAEGGAASMLSAAKGTRSKAKPRKVRVAVFGF